MYDSVVESIRNLSFQQHISRDVLQTWQPEQEAIVRDSFLLNMASVAALTWVVYDMLINFQREVKLVWNRWHSSKGRYSRRLYVIVRYFSIINLACRAWYYIVLVNTSIITLLPDVMLLIRVNAVYAWDFRTLLLSTSIFIIQTTTSLIVGVLAVSSAQFYPGDSTLVTGCPIALTANIARFTLVAWITSIVSQATYFMFMLNALGSLVRSLDVGTTARPVLPSHPQPSTLSSSPQLTTPSLLPRALASNDSPRAKNRLSASTQRSIPFSPLSSASSSKSIRYTSRVPTAHMSTVSKSTSRSIPVTNTSSLRQSVNADCNANDNSMKTNVNDITNSTGGDRKADDTAQEPIFSQSPSSSVPLQPSPNLSTSSSKRQSKVQSAHLHQEPETNETKNLDATTRPIRRTTQDIALFSLFSWEGLKQVKKLVPTMMVFVGHGWWYFSLGILAKVANAVLVTRFTGPLQSFAIPFMMSLYPILVTRIYLTMVQYLHYRVPMKNPRLLASYEGQDFASGYGGDEDDYDDDGDYNDDDDNMMGMDDAYNRHGIESTWEVEERLTQGRLRFSDGRRYEGPAGKSTSDTGKEAVKGKQGPSRRNSDMRISRIRGPQLGRITFAVRESLATSSVLDLAFLRDEEF